MEHRAGVSPSTPLAADEFAARMSRLGPFEPEPRIAVGCSGGGDSMALTLLLQRWTTANRGRLTALVVDHRLRPGSTGEARQTVDWLSDRGIEACILTRPDTPLRGNLQAAAREARYALMAAYCARAGISSLALAHNLEDQAETVLLRLARGSGVDGLAAMAPIAERPEVRLLRPVLDVPRARLRAALRVAEQPHIEDPSNQQEAFKRVRLRRIAPILAAEGLTSERLAATAAQMGRARAALEDVAAGVLARSVRLYPEGYAELDPGPLRAAQTEIGLRCLSRLLACIGGRAQPPRLEPLTRLHQALVRGGEPFAGGTLAGCRILPRRGKLLVCRELRGIRETCTAAADLLWDGRFRLRLAPSTGLQVRRLGRDGWGMVTRERPDLRDCRIPEPVRPSLPALWDLDAVTIVPHLNYVRAGGTVGGDVVREIEFAPARPLTTARFAVHSD